MKVFVAGASGAIDRPLLAALVAAKHEVIGMTSKDAGIKVLREKGADGVVVNALDAEAVRAEIARVRPDAIIDELTSLPKRYTLDEIQLRGYAAKWATGTHAKTPSGLCKLRMRREKTHLTGVR